jgi:ParB family chromosome partitioning protein
VGEEAYVAAGGTIRRDLFGEDVWFEDGPRLIKLFDEKIASIKSDLEAEGWSFVKLVEPGDPQIYWNKLTPKDAPAPEDLKRLKQIDREIKNLGKNYEDDDADWSAEDTAKHFALESERDTIEAKGFTDRQRKASGVIVYVDEFDGLQILRGRVEPSKPAKRGASSPSPLAGEGGPGTGPDEGSPARAEEEPDFTGQLLADLSGAMGGALQMTLVEKPGQALRLLIATLIMQAKSFTTPLFRLNPQSYAAPSPAHEEYRALLSELMRDAEGKDFFATLQHLDQLDEDAHMKLLAILLANALNWSMHPGADGKALVRRLDPDCARWFKPDEAFFNRLKKPQLVDALADLDPIDAKARENRKKPELVARCLEVLAPAGWLPAPLRSPCYAGPGGALFADARAADIAARSSAPSPLAGEGAAPAADEGSERQLEAAE